MCSISFQWMNIFLNRKKINYNNKLFIKIFFCILYAKQNCCLPKQFLISEKYIWRSIQIKKYILQINKRIFEYVYTICFSFISVSWPNFHTFCYLFNKQIYHFSVSFSVILRERKKALCFQIYICYVWFFKFVLLFFFFYIYNKIFINNNILLDCLLITTYHVSLK